MSIGSANAGFILKQERVILRAIVCAFPTNDMLLHFMYDREKANIATAFRVTSKCWIALPGNIHTRSILFQRHVALLVTNNALCPMSGLLSDI